MYGGRHPPAHGSLLRDQHMLPPAHGPCTWRPMGPLLTVSMWPSTHGPLLRGLQRAGTLPWWTLRYILQLTVLCLWACYSVESLKWSLSRWLLHLTVLCSWALASTHGCSLLRPASSSRSFTLGLRPASQPPAHDPRLLVPSSSRSQRKYRAYLHWRSMVALHSRSFATGLAPPPVVVPPAHGRCSSHGNSDPPSSSSSSRSW